MMTRAELYEAKRYAVSAGETPLGLMLVTLITEVERLGRLASAAAKVVKAKKEWAPFPQDCNGYLSDAIDEMALTLAAARPARENEEGY